MAKQKGPIKISGKVDDKTYFKAKHDYRVKKAGKKPKLSNATEEVNSDFDRAQKPRVLFKDSFEPLARHCTDNCMDDRLKRVAIKAIYAGPKALRGKRAFTDGDMGLFNHFEFNGNKPVKGLVSFTPTVTIDPKGFIQIELPEMAIADMFNAPRGASHAVIQFRCCGFLFDKNDSCAIMLEDLVISLREDRFYGCEAELALAEGGECPLN